MSIVEQKLHTIKCWPGPFAALRCGDKPFEFRKNDRDYRVYDKVIAREWDNERGDYTGREALRTITYVLKDGFGVPEGYCVLGFGFGPDGVNEIAKTRRHHALMSGYELGSDEEFHFSNGFKRAASIYAAAPQEQAPADKDAEPDAINARRYLQVRKHAGQIGMMLWRHAPWTHESADENKARLDLCLDEEFVELQSQPQQVTK